jgi:hypothetical protein
LNFTGTPNGGTIRGYNIYNLIGGNYVRFNSDSTYTVTTANTSSSYAITALTNGTQLQRGSAYTFYGKTDNGLLTATYSQINVTLPTLPGTPTGLAVSFTTSSPITLSWTAPSSTNSAIQGYYVYYNTVNNNSAGDIQYGARVSGTSVNITGLTQGQTYYFSVAAQNTIGVGSKTAYVSAVYPSVPGTPSDLRTNVGNLSIELFWFDPANGGSSITSYKIYENGSLKLTVPIGNTTLYPTGRRSYNLTGLTKGATYLYKVSAVNAVGEGGQSNQVSEIADSVPTAIPRSNISIDLDPDTNFIIRWTPPSDYTQNSNNSIISYQIAFAVETGGTSTLPGTLSNPNTNIPVPSGSWGTLNVYADRSNISTSIEVGVGLYEVIRSNLAVYTHVSSFYAVGSRKKGIQVLTNNATQYTGTGSNPTPGLVSYTTTNGITLQDEPTMPPVDIYNQYYTVPMSYTNLTSYTSNRSITIAIYNSPMASDDPYPNVLRNYDYSKRNMVFMIRSYNRYGWSDWSPFFSKNPNSVHSL